MLGIVENKRSYASALNFGTSSNVFSHQNVHRSANQILLVENADKMEFTNTINIKKELARHFPNRNLLHAFRNSRGKIPLEFGSQEEATETSDAWEDSYFGDNTSVQNLQGSKKVQAVLLRDIDPEVEEKIMQEDLMRLVRK